MGKGRINEKAMQAVAQRLKQVRKARGISQMSVFIDTDFHIGRIELGRTNITISTLFSLCSYYKISPEEFFKGIKTE